MFSGIKFIKSVLENLFQHYFHKFKCWKRFPDVEFMKTILEKVPHIEFTKITLGKIPQCCFYKNKVGEDFLMLIS